MTMTRTALTDEDIRSLVKGQSADARAIAAHKICRHIEGGGNDLTPEEREQAYEILRIMADDAAELVRRALAVTLKSSPMVPHDVAIRLAKDVDSVSLPILNFSPVFTDQDLLRDRPGRRPDPPGGHRQPPDALRAGDHHHRRARHRKGGADCLRQRQCRASPTGPCRRWSSGSRARKRCFPPWPIARPCRLSVTEKLITVVSDQLRDHLINHHALTPQLALQIAMGSRERATIDLVDQAGRTPDVKSFVGHLHKAERLSASLLLRALAHGHMTFFEWGLAELAGVPHHRTWLMVHDAGPLGLKAIYDRAGLPPRLFAAFRVGVDTFHGLDEEGGAFDAAQFQERMLQRFLTQPNVTNREDMDYLVDKLDRVRREVRLEARLA